MFPWDRCGEIVRGVNAKVGKTTVVFLSDFDDRMAKLMP